MISEKLDFVRIWLFGLYRPSKAVDLLGGKAAPHFGLLATLLHGGLVALLWYLPAALIGRTPSPSPYLTFVASERYFAFLVWIFPLFALATWLMGGALSYLLLRLNGRQANFDLILNIYGMGGLVGTIPLLVFDWTNLLLGFPTPVILWGIIHLLIDTWYIIFTVTGFRKLLGLSFRLSLGLVAIDFVIGVPLAALFMRG